MSVASNLAVSVVAGVAVMFIWQQIQKAQAKKGDSMEIDHGGVQGGKTAFGGLYTPYDFLGVNALLAEDGGGNRPVNFGDGIIDYLQGITPSKKAKRILA